MLKVLAAAVLLATSIYAGPAAARGGGAAEPMPSINYTDVPSYRPRPGKPRAWVKHVHSHVQWRQSASSHGN